MDHAFINVVQDWDCLKMYIHTYSLYNSALDEHVYMTDRPATGISLGILLLALRVKKTNNAILHEGSEFENPMMWRYLFNMHILVILINSSRGQFHTLIYKLLKWDALCLTLGLPDAVWKKVYNKYFSFFFYILKTNVHIQRKHKRDIFKLPK